MKKYKICWVNVCFGSSGYVPGKLYINKQDADRDAERFNKMYPGLKHIAKEMEDKND